MDHTLESLELEHHVGGGRKEIWRVTIILSVFTLVELALGVWLMNLEEGEGAGMTIAFIKGVIVIFMLAKAFYIVSVFMHLGDEIRNMIMTIVVPLMLFVWFIGAFLWDGNSYRTMRNRYDKYHEQRTLPREEKAGDTTQHGLG